jgi:hypothetical protein
MTTYYNPTPKSAFHLHSTRHRKEKTRRKNGTPQTVGNTSTMIKSTFVVGILAAVAIANLVRSWDHAATMSTTTTTESGIVTTASIGTNRRWPLSLPTTPSRIPNVLVAGSQKAGTSWIFHYLESNHEVCTPIPLGETYPDLSLKEVHFFDMNTRYKRGLSFYQSRWRHCGVKKIILDSTPNYMLHPDRVRKTYDKQGTADDVKLIFVLREPVSREISSYNFQVDLILSNITDSWLSDTRKPGGGVRNFEEYLARKERMGRGTVPFQFSLYGPHLKKWFDMFDRKQILVLSFDELRSNRTAFSERIRQFLMISDVLELPGKDNQSTSAAVPSCELQKELAKRFESSNAELYALLEKHPGPEMEQRPFPKFESPC